MHLWKASDNYMGKDYSEFYVLLSRTRDSGLLDQSNWDTVLEAIGGESDYVQVVHLGHWACGWVEFIGVHKDTPILVLSQAMAIYSQLQSYPVWDEQDYSNRQWDAAVRYWRELPAHYRQRDHGATAKEARRSFAWIARNAENVYESVTQAVND